MSQFLGNYLPCKKTMFLALMKLLRHLEPWTIPRSTIDHYAWYWMDIHATMYPCIRDMYSPTTHGILRVIVILLRMLMKLGCFEKYVHVSRCWKWISREEEHAFVPKEIIEDSRAMKNALNNNTWLCKGIHSTMY